MYRSAHKSHGSCAHSTNPRSDICQCYHQARSAGNTNQGSVRALNIAKSKQNALQEYFYIENLLKFELILHCEIKKISIFLPNGYILFLAIFKSLLLSGGYSVTVENSQEMCCSLMNTTPNDLWFRPTYPHGCPLEPPSPYGERTGCVRSVQATYFKDCRLSYVQK